MPALVLLAGVVALLLGAFVLLFPAQFRAMASDDIARLVWLLLAALLVGGGAFGMRGRGGGQVGLGQALTYLAIWAAIFAGGVIFYQLYQAYFGGPARVST